MAKTKERNFRVVVALWGHDNYVTYVRAKDRTDARRKAKRIALRNIKVSSVTLGENV